MGQTVVRDVDLARRPAADRGAALLGDLLETAAVDRTHRRQAPHHGYSACHLVDQSVKLRPNGIATVRIVARDQRLLLQFAKAVLVTLSDVVEEARLVSDLFRRGLGAVAAIGTGRSGLSRLGTIHRALDVLGEPSQLVVDLGRLGFGLGGIALAFGVERRLERLERFALLLQQVLDFIGHCDAPLFEKVDVAANHVRQLVSRVPCIPQALQAFEAVGHKGFGFGT